MLDIIPPKINPGSNLSPNVGSSISKNSSISSSLFTPSSVNSTSSTVIPSKLSLSKVSKSFEKSPEDILSLKSLTISALYIITKYSIITPSTSDSNLLLLLLLAFVVVVVITGVAVVS